MLENLPIYCDGSDGSIWRLDKEEWSRILSGEVNPATRFVRVIDVLKLIEFIDRSSELTEYYVNNIGKEKPWWLTNEQKQKSV